MSLSPREKLLRNLLLKAVRTATYDSVLDQLEECWSATLTAEEYRWLDAEMSRIADCLLDQEQHYDETTHSPLPQEKDKDCMKTLSKAQIAARESLCAQLRTAYADLEAALIAYSDTLTPLWNDVEEAQNAYNVIVEDANAWKEEIASAIQDAIDARSYKWHEGAAGHAYEAWRIAWEEDELETVEIEQPEMPGLDITDQSELLDALPEDPQ